MNEFLHVTDERHVHDYFHESNKKIEQQHCVNIDSSYRWHLPEKISEMKNEFR
jgi:hypothetical protein